MAIEVYFYGRLRDIYGDRDVFDYSNISLDELINILGLEDRYVRIFIDGSEVRRSKGGDLNIFPSQSIAIISEYKDDPLRNIAEYYKIFRGRIEARIKSFLNVSRCGYERIFMELLFTICTPQSNPVKCWDSVKRIYLSGMFNKPDISRIRSLLKGVRFPNNKARYLYRAIKMYLRGELDIGSILEGDIYFVRDRLSNLVMGIGYKEASHFLRNIGYTFNIAILDRHILRWMNRLNLIGEIPRNISKGRYILLEDRFIWLSKYIGLKPAELDLLLWGIETGYIFK